MATSTTEMGSSSTADGSGDLALDIITMFKSLKHQFSTGGLISVPDHLRKLDEQAFTPLLISIGPIHRSNAKLQTMKKLKVLFCESFINRTNINLIDLIHRIRVREKDIRSYYAETIVSSIISDLFVTMIVVDGLFILEFFWRQSNPTLVEDNPMVPEWMLPILKLDLVLLENQLPFFVLVMLAEQAYSSDAATVLKGLALEFFECYNFQEWDFVSVRLEIEHFTDLVRLFYLSEQLPCRKAGWAKLSYSATELHEVGVKFDGNTGRDKDCRHFLDMRFDLKNGVLKIPCIILSNEKIRLFRNIIALEQSLYFGSTYVTDFIVFLNMLVKTSEDVDLLCDMGILVNYLGDSNVAASTVNSLNTQILGGFMNEEYLKICEELNASYKQLWSEKFVYWQLWYLLRAQLHELKKLLWRQYFSTAWRATSTSGAFILLVLTVIQTVCSLKSTKW